MGVIPELLPDLINQLRALDGGGFYYFMILRLGGL